MPVAYASLGRRPVEDEKPLLNELGKLFHVVRAQHKEDKQVRKRQKEQTERAIQSADSENEKNKDANNKKANEDNTGKKKSNTTNPSKLIKRASKRKSVNGGSIWITLKGGFANCNVPLSFSSTEELETTNKNNDTVNDTTIHSTISNAQSSETLIKSKSQMRKRIARRVFLTLHKRENALQAAEAYITSAWNEADAANLLISTNKNNNSNNSNDKNNKSTLIDERIPVSNEGLDYLREQYSVASHMLALDKRPVGQYLFDLVNKYNNATLHKSDEINNKKKKRQIEFNDFEQIYKQVACKWLHHCKKSPSTNNSRTVTFAKFCLNRNNNSNNSSGVKKGQNNNNNNHVCLEDVLYSMDIREEMIRSFLYNIDGTRQAETNIANEINQKNNNNSTVNNEDTLFNYYTEELKEYMLNIAEHVEERSNIGQSYLYETKKANHESKNKYNKKYVEDDDEDEEDEFREAKEYTDEDDDNNNNEEEEEEYKEGTVLSGQGNVENDRNVEKMVDIIPTKCIVKIRNSQRHKHTSILHSQKAINYFVSNFMQTLKRELGSASCKLPRGPIETVDHTDTSIINTTSISGNTNANVAVNTNSSKRNRKR